MGRLPKEIKYKFDKKSGRYLVAFPESGGHYFQTPESDQGRAIQWARRNKPLLVAEAEDRLLIKDLAPGFFDEGSPWYQDKLKKSEGMTKGSLAIRQGNIKNYIIPIFGEYDIREITGYQIDQGILSAVGVQKATPNLAKGTRSKILYSMKLMFDRWQYQGLIKENPTAGIIKYSRKPEHPRSNLPADACERLFPRTHAELVKVWGSTLYGVVMLALFDTGARPGELRAKTWDGYYPEERFLPYRTAIESGTADKEKKTKGGQISPAYVTKRTAQELEIWRLESRFNTAEDYIFTLDGRVPLSIPTIESVFKRALAYLGYDTEGWTPYWLRHTFVSYAAEALDDSQMIMAVGHTNIGMNSNYRHLTDRIVLKRSVGIRDSLDELREKKG